jgi:Zn-dependent peptidase ImmA (M78 family)
MSKIARRLILPLLAALLAPGLAAAQNAANPAPAAAAERTTVPPAKGLAVSDAVLRDVAKLRGLPVLKPVTNGLKSRTDIRSIVLEDMAKSTTPRKLADSTLLLRFLGLVPQDFELERETVALLTEQIAGFYDPQTKVFYLADWIPLDEQRPVMAHELTHALTDQHFDLKRFEKWPDGDSDAELAARALVEGDATALMIEYSLDERGAPHDLAKLPVSLSNILRTSVNEPDAEHPVFTKAPAVLKQSLQFPYVYGVGFVQELLRNGSWTRVSDAYRALPASTEQVIHPQKYLTNEQPVKVALPDVSSLLGKDWSRIDSDVNGEFGYYLILGASLDDRNAASAAAGWGGDHYDFYVDATRTKPVLVHESAWDSEREAQEFYGAYAERVAKRFNVAETPGADAAKTWKTTEGIVYLERRGNRVLAVEGYRGEDVAPVVKALWESKT